MVFWGSLACCPSSSAAKKSCLSSLNHHCRVSFTSCTMDCSKKPAAPRISRLEDGTFRPKWIDTCTRTLSDDEENYLQKKMDDDAHRVLDGKCLTLMDDLWYAELLHGGRKYKCLGVERGQFNAEIDTLLKKWETHKIHIPIHIGKKHWFGVSVLPDSRTIRVYDSCTKYAGKNRNNISGPCDKLTKKGMKELGIKERIGDILSDIHTKCCELDEAKEGRMKFGWKFEVVNDFIYQQNAVDCGVFVCLFFDLVTKNVTLVPPRKELECKYDIKQMRRWVAYSVLSVKERQNGRMK